MKVQWTQFFIPLIAKKFNASSSNLSKESFGGKVVMLSKLSCTCLLFLKEKQKI